MQKQLKEEEGRVTKVYSFETEEEYRNRVQDFLYDGVKLMYNGTKINLCQMDEEFWKPLVELFDAPFICYKYYSDDEEAWMCFCKTAKESGLSAIEDIKGEFIIIVQENRFAFCKTI